MEKETRTKETKTCSCEDCIFEGSARYCDGADHPEECDMYLPVLC